jgi:hypothetical protein
VSVIVGVGKSVGVGGNEERNNKVLLMISDQSNLI